MAELSIQGVSPATLKAYRSHTDGIIADAAEHLGKDPGNVELDELDRNLLVKAIAAYKDRPDGRDGKRKQRSPASVALRLAAARTWLSWCEETGKVEKNEAAKIRPPKARARVPRGMSSNECDELLAAARKARWKERDELVVLLGLTLGLRLAEIAALEVHSLGPDAETPQQIRILGKGSKERLLPVPENLAAAIAAYLPTRRERLQRWETETGALLLSSRPRTVDGKKEVALSCAGVGEIHERLLRAAGLKQPGRRCHSSRHSWATLGLAGRSHDVEQLRAALGHSSSATTGRYLSTDTAALARAAAAHPLSNLGRGGEKNA